MQSWINPAAFSAPETVGRLILAYKELFFSAAGDSGIDHRLGDDNHLGGFVLHHKILSGKRIKQRAAARPQPTAWTQSINNILNFKIARDFINFNGQNRPKMIFSKKIPHFSAG